MKHLQYIREFKNIGPLYHIVDIDKLAYILENNIMKPKNFFNGISTTRNKNMNGYLGDNYTSIFKLEIDTEKLSYNYKIKPFAASYTEIGMNNRKKKYFQEYEEVIKTKEIKNARKYIKKIIIIKSKVEKAINTGWFNTDGGYFRGGRITYPEYFKKYILNCDIPIYVQDGNKIVKDDEWINEIINYPIKTINHGYVYYNKENRKHTKFKYGTEEYYVPIDNYNIDLKTPVIGYEYDNIYLTNKEGGDYKFDFTYELEDIIEETDDYKLISKVKLTDIKKYH